MGTFDRVTITIVVTNYYGSGPSPVRPMTHMVQCLISVVETFGPVTLSSLNFSGRVPVGRFFLDTVLGLGYHPVPPGLRTLSVPTCSGILSLSKTPGNT